MITWYKHVILNTKRFVEFLIVFIETGNLFLQQVLTDTHRYQCSEL